MESLQNLGLWGLFIGTFLAATFIPFSSDAMFVGVLAATKQPVACLFVGTHGNWLGSITSYLLGRLAKWEWIEKTLKLSREKLESSKKYIDKYGIWMALLSWIPGIGDVITIALGFYKTPWTWTFLLLLIGKFGRFVVWMFLFKGAFA